MPLDLDWELIGRVRRIFATSKSAMTVVYAKREGQRRTREVMAVSNKVFETTDRLEEFKEKRNIKWHEIKAVADLTPKAVRFIRANTAKVQK